MTAALPITITFGSLRTDRRPAENDPAWACSDGLEASAVIELLLLLRAASK
jgi:hypothetical protein